MLPLPLSRAATPGVVPSCAEAGVLGVICGVIASIQGVETIKLLLGSATRSSDGLCFSTR